MLTFNSRNQNSDKIRILIAYDHPLLRQALKNVLEKQGDFEVVAEAGDGEEAVKLAGELLPDIVIMDISMPRMNGLEATKLIKMKYPEISVLVLTIHNDNEHILNILACRGVFIEHNILRKIDRTQWF